MDSTLNTCALEAPWKRSLCGPLNLGWGSGCCLLTLRSPTHNMPFCLYHAMFVFSLLQLLHHSNLHPSPRRPGWAPWTVDTACVHEPIMKPMLAERCGFTVLHHSTQPHRWLLFAPFRHSSVAPSVLLGEIAAVPPNVVGLENRSWLVFGGKWMEGIIQ